MKYKGYTIYQADNKAWYISEIGHMFSTKKEAKEYVDLIVSEAEYINDLKNKECVK